MLSNTRLGFSAVLLMAMLHSRMTAASTMIVPDDTPTIQAAIHAGVDTILVRSGDYAESVSANRGIVLHGIGESRPRIAGLTISNPFWFLSIRWEVSQIDITGRVDLLTDNPDARYIQIAFLACTLQQGLQHVLSTDPYDIDILSLTACRLPELCEARAAVVIMSADTVDAGVRWGVIDELSVQDCWFRGGSGTGLHIAGDELGGLISDNIIENYAIGIYASNLSGLTVKSNAIRGAREVALEVDGTEATIRQNRFEDCGVGLRSELNRVGVYDNTVLRGHGTSLWFGQPDRLTVEGNVVGVSEGSAIAVLHSDGADLSFLRNTVFGNGSSAFDLLNSVNSRIVIQNNIGSRNGGWGVRVVEPQVSITLGCNDWFENGFGPTFGVTPNEDDVLVDPNFCDVSAYDVRLYSDSRLVGHATCGQIGAKDVGCVPPILKTLNISSRQAGLGLVWEFEAALPLESWAEKADELGGAWDSLGIGRSVGGKSFELLDEVVAPDRQYYYRVVWRDRGTVVRGIAVVGTWTDAGRLSSVSPNPAIGDVAVEWVLARPGTTEIRVFDLAGREVTTVARGMFDVGQHQVRWDGRWEGRGVAPAGMYILRIVSGERTRSHRVVLLR